MEQLLLKQSDKLIAFRHPANIQQEGLIKEIKSVKSSKLRLGFYYLGCVLSLGILYLLCRWMVGLWIFMRTTYTAPAQALYFIIIGMDRSETIVKKSSMVIDGEMRTVFEFRLYRYYYDDANSMFVPIETDFVRLKNSEVIEKHRLGITDEDHLLSITGKFGKNNTQIPDKGILKTLLDEVLSPFYIFQVFSVLLWYFANYANYATIIFLTSVISVVLTLIESRKNFKRLQSLSKFSINLNVYRGIHPQFNQLRNGRLEITGDSKGYQQHMNSLELVPGDIIEIEDNMTMPCDAILLNGQTIINESMLTGESIPVLKMPLPYTSLIYNPTDEGKQSTLFAGTLCMETKIPRKGQVPVLALVTETGFNTMKGQLIRSIMFPQENSFQFYVDSMKFIGVMAVIAVIGFCCTVPNKIHTLLDGSITTWDFISEGLDLITITVPPALPTCLQIGVSIALSRLQAKTIYCICPPKVNICGKVTVMCFDKTGTLTEEGLDLYGVRSVGHVQSQNCSRFQDVVTTCDQLKKQHNSSFEEFQTGNFKSNQDKHVPVINPFISKASTLIEIMASCHGLAWVQGNLVGDPLEVKLFEATGWQLIESQEDLLLATVIPPKHRAQSSLAPELQLESYHPAERIGICKRFEFSSKLQRMSVIVKDMGSTSNRYRVHVKGSPEKLRELCQKKYIPSSFHKMLDLYAQNGFRVLAIASKTIVSDSIDSIQRDEAECDLVFLGLIIMQNKLKEITTSIIEELTAANIRSIMVTGDNVLTAISVARQCNIIRPHQRVYLGELSEKRLPNGLYRVLWRDFEQSSHQLNPDNLNREQLGPDFEESDEQTDKELREESMRLKLTNTDGPLGPDEEDYTKKMAKNQSLLEEPPPKATQSERKQSDKVRNANSITSQLYSALMDEKQEFEAEEEVPIWQSCVDDYVLAVSGGAFNQLLHQDNPTVLRLLMEKGQVYARMRPEEKAILVKQLQEKSLRKPLVGFCGDGANDCGALKGADMGVSLSQAEASIAAPFTSQIQDISCIPLILREGRAALTTSFNCFKFMAMYSVIQFAQVTVLYLTSSNLTDNQYLYNDLITIFPLSMTLGFTQANPKLNKYVPGGSLISLPVLASVFGQSVIVIAFQLSMYFVLRSQSWFMDTFEANKDDLSDDALQVCYENTTLFLFGNFQYIAVTIAFAVGRPFRRPFYTNIWLMMSIAALLTLDLLCLFVRWSWNDEWIGLKFEVKYGDEVVSRMPQSWLYVIALVALVNAIAIIVFERIAITRLAQRQKHQQVQQK